MINNLDIGKKIIKDNLGNQVSTGVYYLKLSAKGHYQKTEKVLFLK